MPAEVWCAINEFHVRFATELLAYFTEIIIGTIDPNVPVLE
jgi:hypothetical protein